MKASQTRRSTSSAAAGQACKYNNFSISIFIVCPFELIKCRAQLENREIMSITGEVKRVVSRRGIRGLYKGLVVTAWRDIPSVGIYFTTFNMLLDYFNSIGKTNVLYMIHSGGTAGVLSMVFLYPVDVLKSYIQSRRGKTLSMAEAARQVVRMGGNGANYMNLFNGMRATVLRLYLYDAIVLPVVHHTRIHLKSYFI